MEKLTKNLSEVSDLFKKTGYNTKILDTETKSFTISDYNKFTSEILQTKIKEKRIVDKTSLSNLVKNFYLNTADTALSTKA